MHYPEPLEKLIQFLKKMPGVGRKTAERFAFHLLLWPKNQLVEFADAIAKAQEKLNTCQECGCLLDTSPCPFCDISKRQTHLLCIVGSVKDIFLIEKTREFRGLYHVLGGLLSPITGQSPALLRIDILKKRIEKYHVKEVILALDSTLEGDVTAHFLKKELDSLSLLASRLALGLPMGSSLDYIDGGTLARAFSGRRTF
jgi:recombination protein RecR